MKIVNSTPVINFLNNAFVYLCQADDGSFWIRSVAGKWARVTAEPRDYNSVAMDFDAFVLNNPPVTLTEIKDDNSKDFILEPIKYVPPPPPEPTPIPDPIPEPEPSPEPVSTATTTPSTN